MVVHRDQAEEVVVGLGHRLRRPVLVDGADLELLEVAAVAVRAGGLALGLVGGQLVRLVSSSVGFVSFEVFGGAASYLSPHGLTLRR